MNTSDLDPTPDQPARPRPRWSIGGGALLVGMATLVAMLATEPRLAIVWDEGFTLGREERIRLWLKALADPPGFAARWEPPRPWEMELVQPDDPPLPPPRREEIDTLGELLGPKALAYFWPFAREEPHGHPPFYAIVGMLGDLVAPGWEALPRARLGPIAAFSLASGAIFALVAGRWGVVPGLVAAGAWAGQPNLFGHGHYATLDGLLASLWVGATLAFIRAVEAPTRVGRAAWAVALGALLGWAGDTKLTGWFLPIPLLAWAIWEQNGRAVRVLGVAALVGAATLYAFNPCWWHAPVDGINRFLRSNLTRAQTIPIPVQFFGTIYNTPRQSLPWYNTLAWTVLVTPVGILGLGLLGAGEALIGLVRRRWRRPDARPDAPGDGFAVLVLMQWGMLLVLRALPHTPGHDGVRLILPAFGMLALMASSGARRLVAWSPRWGAVVGVGAILEGFVSIALVMPTPLAYFSPIVGGPAGAARLGMEPTYFWDGLSDEALEFLNTRTPSGRTVRFSTFPTSWFYLQRSGRLRVDLWSPRNSNRPAFFVMQNRPGAFGPAERRFLASGPPAFRTTCGGVPLVLIYPLP